MKHLVKALSLSVAVLWVLSCSQLDSLLRRQTPLSPGSQSWNDAVAAEDDISIGRFIANELSLVNLPAWGSKIAICYEEKPQSLTADPETPFASQYESGCGSSQEGDFSMSATVVLQSSAPTSACGYVFRADRTAETWYLLRLERTGDSSRWSLEYVRNGAVETVIREPAADAHLNLADGAQTRVLLYANGDDIRVFFNSFLAGKITDSSLAAGETGLFAESESGKAACRFDSFWINMYRD